jgi:hypothetical protein
VIYFYPDKVGETYEYFYTHSLWNDSWLVCFRRGFVIPATEKEDASGVDFWIKMPRDCRIFPVQVTQRGVRMFRKFHQPSEEKLCEFIHTARARIEAKRKRMKKHGIAFVLVRDFRGHHTNPQLAWGDIKALRYAIAHLKRWL